MAYQIRYTETSMIRETKASRKPSVKWIFVCCVVVVLVGVLQFDGVRNYLIPGDPEVTKAAFSSFTQDLENGERFGEAVAAFCRQVIKSDLVE